MSTKEEYKIGRFDQVRLLTTKRVTYLSSRSGEELSPHGLWSVVAAVGEKELLCVRKGSTIKIPAEDVLKIAEYDLSEVTSVLGNLSNVKSKRQATSG